MMSAYPPFNTLLLLLSPIYFLIGEESLALPAINKSINLVIYMPVAMLATLLFVSVNILLLPLAYLVAVSVKI